LNEFLDILAVSAFRLLLLIGYILPVRVMLKIGRFCGIMLMFLGPKRKATTYTNLRAAFCREKTPQELSKLTRDVFANFGEVFAEVLCFPKMDKKYADKYVEVKNMEILEKAIGKGKGIIFLTAHYGNWELAAIKSTYINCPLYILARDQKMKRVTALLNSIRESKGSKVVSKGISVKTVVRALADNRIIAWLADQSGGDSGVIADFFGRPVPTAYGPFRFAAKTGATILLIFNVRQSGPYHCVYIHSAMEVKDHINVLPYVQEYNNILEQYIRKKPDHWLWLHRRWKKTKQRNVVILSDGKAGHLNQSKGILRMFMDFRKSKNADEACTKTEIIEIKYKNAGWKKFLNLLGILPACFHKSCFRLLKVGLTEESYKKLETTFADIVISSGSSLAAVNSFYCAENGAKNAICMKPSFINLKNFDLVILPRHDIRRKVKYKHVVVTDIALSNINKQTMEDGRAKLSEHINLENKKVIGILVGGDTDDIVYEEAMLERILKEIALSAEKEKADILISTSRRTSSGIEKKVMEEVASKKQCKLCIIANENNLPYAVPGILGMADMLIVSGESISMVSEAVSSGKPVLIFNGKKTGPKETRHDRFIRTLEETALIKVAGENGFSQLISETLNGVVKQPQTGDEKSDAVFMNMWRLGV